MITFICKNTDYSFKAPLNSHYQWHTWEWIHLSSNYAIIAFSHTFDKNSNCDGNRYFFYKSLLWQWAYIYCITLQSLQTADYTGTLMMHVIGIKTILWIFSGICCNHCRPYKWVYTFIVMEKEYSIWGNS